jgi:hypothetical protein
MHVRYSQPTEGGAKAILRLVTTLVAVLTLGLLAAACGEDLKPPPVVVSPSPAASVPASVESPAPLPTSSAVAGTMLVGTASIRLEGDITGDVSLLMLVSPAVYSPPPGSTAVVWTDGLQTLGITGDSFVGVSDTSTTLSLSLQVRNGAELVVFNSTAGECTVTMDTAIERSFTGSFTCRGLSGSTSAGLALSVDATGTFSASG